jgi:molybdopterin converting factor subunit 1
MGKEIQIQYFAILREQRGVSEESLTTSAATLGNLYDELKEIHQFSLDIGSLKVIVNEEFSEWDRPFEQGDSVVFIPPVAGG